MTAERTLLFRLGLALGLTVGAAGMPQTPGQLNTEVYGNGLGSVRQSGLASMGNQPWDFGVLGSEWQHNAFLSGRLGSEIRGDYLARGPLAPGGLAAYVPEAPTPFGSARPYSAPPMSGAGAPAAPVLRSAAPRRAAGAVAPAMPLGLTTPMPAGSLRFAAAAPMPMPSAAPAPLPDAVKPPLSRFHGGGSLRHAATHEPQSHEAPLVIPPLVGADETKDVSKQE